jgi:hypothetical protein
VNNGPRFDISHVTNVHHSPRGTSYLTPAAVSSAQSGLGVSTTQDFASAFTFDDTEMDLSGSNGHPSPATISTQSRGGSTSHSSYSPSTNEHHLPYRASPKPGFNQPAATFQSFTATPATSIPTSSPSLHGGVEMFSNVYSTTGLPAEETFNQGFLMGSDWEYAAMNAGTGMTPMSDGNWNSMLESVTMGWDGLPAGQEGEGRI